MSRVLQALDRNLRGVTVTGTVVDTTGVKEDTTKTASASPNAAASTDIDSLLPTMPAGDEGNVPLPKASEDRPFSSYLLTIFDGGAVVDERQVEVVTKLLATDQAQRAIPSTPSSYGVPKRARGKRAASAA